MWKIFSRRDSNPTPLHMQEPFVLLNQPKAGQELNRALTGIADGRKLALGQMRLLSNLMEREKADHEARMAELLERHATISRQLGEASGLVLPQAEPQVLSSTEYRAAVTKAAATGGPAVVVNTQAAAAERMRQASAAIASASGTKP